MVWVLKVCPNRVQNSGESGQFRWTRVDSLAVHKLLNLQNNPAMTPVCPIDVPVLRIRRSGVQLPPGAQQVAGISRKGTVSMVSLVSTNTRSITGLQDIVTGIELRFSTLGRAFTAPARL